MENLCSLKGRGLQEDMGIEPGSANDLSSAKEPIPFDRSQRTNDEAIAKISYKNDKNVGSEKHLIQSHVANL